MMPPFSSVASGKLLPSVKVVSAQLEIMEMWDVSLRFKTGK